MQNKTSFTAIAVGLMAVALAVPVQALQDKTWKPDDVVLVKQSMRELISSDRQPTW